MRHDADGFAHGPMDPGRYAELVQLQQARLADAPASPGTLESFILPTRTSDLARQILDEALERRLTGGEILVLFDEATMHDLGRVAHELRLRRTDPDVVTYIIDRNVTYTNLCYANCLFCAFNRHQGDADAYVLDLDTIVGKCRTVVEAGGNQILLQGGHHPKERLDYYETMLRGIKSACPDMWIHGFSPSEIQHFAQLNGTGERDVLQRLKQAGLDSVPGGGAEILADRVRTILAPGKSMADDWIRIMETAHGIGLPTTATMMFSHIETHAERVEHLLRVRDSQDRTGGYTAFIPWTFQAGNTPLMDVPELRTRVESIGFLGASDYLRTLAISRIALDNVRNIQASWVTQGKSIGQLTLWYGANDLGSLMMEESVVSAAGTTHPLGRRDLDEMIEGAGFHASLRDNGYNILT